MSTENMSSALREYFQALRQNDTERKEAIQDLKQINELYNELGEPDSELTEYIVAQELDEQKLDRALTKRGF